MTDFAIIEIDIHDEQVVRRAGDISPPPNLFIWFASTDEQTINSLKDLSLNLFYTDEEGGGFLGGAKKQVKKKVVTVVSHQPEWCNLKVPHGFSSWVFWTLLKEICSNGWEPFACAKENHFLFRKQI